MFKSPEDIITYVLLVTGNDVDIFIVDATVVVFIFVPVRGVDLTLDFLACLPSGALEHRNLC